MGSKASKPSSQQLSTSLEALPANEEPLQSLMDEDVQDVENIEIPVDVVQHLQDEVSHMQEDGTVNDIEMIIQAGLHEGDEDDAPANLGKSDFSGDKQASKPGLSIQQAVQQLKEKFSINAPLGTGQESGNGKELAQIREEMDAYGVPRPASTAATRTRSESMSSSGSSDTSDSGGASSSSSSSSGSSLGFGNKRGIKRKANGQAVPAEEDVGGDDDEDDFGGKKLGKNGKITLAEAAGLFATPNEIIEPQIAPPPIEQLPPSARLEVLGQVDSVIDTVIVVKATVVRNAGNNKEGVEQILEEGSLICTSDGRVVGPIFETFGAVTTPLYSIRLPNGSPFLTTLKATDKVYFCPEAQYSAFLYLSDIKKAQGKASDASNLYDEEPHDGEVEFSDDEAEQEYRRVIKAERKKRRDRREWEQEQGNANGEAEFEFDDEFEDDEEMISRAEEEASQTKEAAVIQRGDLEEGEEPRSESASVRSHSSPRGKARRLSHSSDTRSHTAGPSRGRGNGRGNYRGRGGRDRPDDGGRPSRGNGRERGRGSDRGRDGPQRGRGRGRGRGQSEYNPRESRDRPRHPSPQRDRMDGPYNPVRHELPSRPRFQHPDALPYDGPSAPPPSVAPRSPQRPMAALPQRNTPASQSPSVQSHPPYVHTPNIPNLGMRQDGRVEGYDPASPSTSHQNVFGRATTGPLALLQNLQNNPFMAGIPFPMQMNPMMHPPYQPVPMPQQQQHLQQPPQVQIPHQQYQQRLPQRPPQTSSQDKSPLPAAAANRNKKWVNPASQQQSQQSPVATASSLKGGLPDQSGPPSYNPQHPSSAQSMYSPPIQEHRWNQHPVQYPGPPQAFGNGYNGPQQQWQPSSNGAQHRANGRSRDLSEYQIRTQP